MLTELAAIRTKQLAAFTSLTERLLRLQQQITQQWSEVDAVFNAQDFAKEDIDSSLHDLDSRVKEGQDALDFTLTNAQDQGRGQAV